MRPTHTPTILERELADSAVPNADQYSASVYSRASNDELVSASTSTSTSDSDDETDVAAMLPGNDTTDLGTARGHLIESILRTLALFSSLLTAISPPCPFLATSIYLPTQLQGGLQCNATQFSLSTLIQKLNSGYFIEFLRRKSADFNLAFEGSQNPTSALPQKLPFRQHKGTSRKEKEPREQQTLSPKWHQLKHFTDSSISFLSCSSKEKWNHSSIHAIISKISPPSNCPFP
ncbi:hypothetical protein IWX48DRAFT_205956 [Phyllosticta citricarpa]